MDRISADMDAAAGDYRDGDGRSWWVTTRDGARRLVRMQGFDAKSPTTAELLDDPVFTRIGALTGDGHHNVGLVGNRVEALFKPIGVVQGISDVPWHKDCSLGRHSYDCSNLTTGISVTGAAEDSGQLRVRPGSHRALCWPALAQPGLDLPEPPLPTGRATSPCTSRARSTWRSRPSRASGACSTRGSACRTAPMPRRSRARSCARCARRRPSRSRRSRRAPA